MAELKFHFVASERPEASETLDAYSAKFGNTPIEDADIIVAIGGDGFMLDSLKNYLDYHKPIYGINRGTVGFLMNAASPDNLTERILNAENVTVRPLIMTAKTRDGKSHTATAFNEVSLFRETRQTAWIEIIVNDKVRMSRLVCDGVLLATPAGSTAYNLSAHGPILPVGAEMMALTPISPFRPRRWRGALLPDSAVVKFSVEDPDKRPVSAVADNVEVRDVIEVSAHIDKDKQAMILFDFDHSLEERIIREQFDY
ncbi:MAG: NAD kinase [bacterium]